MNYLKRFQPDLYNTLMQSLHLQHLKTGTMILFSLKIGTISFSLSVKTKFYSKTINDRSDGLCDCNNLKKSKDWKIQGTVSQLH